MSVCVQHSESSSRVQVDDMEDFGCLNYSLWYIRLGALTRTFEKKKTQLTETLLQKYAERAIRYLKRHPEFRSRKQLDI